MKRYGGIIVLAVWLLLLQGDALSLVHKQMPMRSTYEEFGFDFTSEDRKPTSGLSFDRKSLDRALNRAMQFDSDLADFRDSQIIANGRSRSALAKRKTVIATNGAKTREPRLALLRSSEEGFERSIYATQRVLKHLGVQSRYVWAFRSNLRQLVNLIKPSNRLTLKSPSIAALLKCGIIKLATDREVLIERLRLALGWIDSVTVRFNRHCGHVLSVLRFGGLDSAYSRRFEPLSF